MNPFAILGRPLAWLDRTVLTFLARLLVHRSSSGTAAATGGALVAGVALTTAILFGVLHWPSAPPRTAMPLTLKPVYAAEQAQMREDQPLFSTGLGAQALHAWSRIPDSGAFGISREEIRAPLQRLLPDVDNLAVAWRAGAVTPTAAAALRDSLKRIDELQKAADRNSDRSAIEYHRALAELFAGDAKNAQSRLRDVIALIDKRLAALKKRQAGGSQARWLEAHRTELARLYGVRVAAEYALGLAQLREGGAPRAAVASLRGAITTAHEEQGLVASASDRLTTGLVTLDPQATLVVLDTADIYADLVAATLVQASRNAPAADDELKGLIGELRGKAVGAHPYLAANLQIAASLEGDAAGVDAFAPTNPPVDDPSLTAAGEEVARIWAPAATAANLDDYWSVTAGWRRRLAAGDAASIRADLRPDASAQRSALRAWLGEVLDAAYRGEPSAAKRLRLVREYGDLFEGSDMVRTWTANAPLVRAGLHPWLALGLSGLVAAAAWYWVLRAIAIALDIRRTWRILYASGYADDVAAWRPERGA